MNFNKSIIPTTDIHGNELGKITFLLVLFLAIFVVFGTILSLSVTLVTAKKQHCCWNVCAYAYTRVRTYAIRVCMYKGGRRMSVRYGQAVN